MAIVLMTTTIAVLAGAVWLALRHHRKMRKVAHAIDDEQAAVEEEINRAARITKHRISL